MWIWSNRWIFMIETSAARQEVRRGVWVLYLFVLQRASTTRGSAPDICNVRCAPACCARTASGHAAAPPSSTPSHSISSSARPDRGSGHCDAERLSGLEVDEQLNFCCL